MRTLVLEKGIKEAARTVARMDFAVRGNRPGVFDASEFDMCANVNEEWL